MHVQKNTLTTDPSLLIVQVWHTEFRVWLSNGVLRGHRILLLNLGTVKVVPDAFITLKWC